MSRNPEFVRNLWLEITIQRLLAVPMILGLLLVIALAVVYDEPWQLVTRMAALGFIIVTVFWGAKQAADAQTEEFVLGTWDAQRTSGLSAGQMLFGKLFGGASFAWYAGFWCLAVFLIGAVQSLPLNQTLRSVVALVAMAVLVQALAVLSSLLAWRKLRQISVRQNRGMSILILVLVLPNLATLLLRGAGDESSLHWFGFEWQLTGFLLASLLAFTGWALLGAHRAMRAELQFSNQPWAWIAFVVFVQVYAVGFIDGSEGIGSSDLAGRLGMLSTQLGLAAGLPLLFGYCFLFTERKDAIRFARLLACFKQRQHQRVIALMPIWAICFLLAAVTALLAVVSALIGRADWTSVVELTAGFAALLLFAVRDVAIVLWCNFGAHQRRADAAATAYLLVLYVVLPLLIATLGFNSLAGLTQPWLCFVEPFWVIAAAAWAAAGLDLLRRRWHLQTGMLA